MLVVTYCPGHSCCALFAKWAFARTVPTCGSTVLSTKLSSPRSGSFMPGTTAVTGERLLAAASKSCKLPSGTGKLTAIGSSCVTVTITAEGCARLPANMGIAPIRPEIGDTMVS
jgi:hypothetical protein